MQTSVHTSIATTLAFGMSFWGNIIQNGLSVRGIFGEIPYLIHPTQEISRISAGRYSNTKFNSHHSYFMYSKVPRMAQWLFLAAGSKPCDGRTLLEKKPVGHSEVSRNVHDKVTVDFRIAIFPRGAPEPNQTSRQHGLSKVTVA